MDVAVYTYGAEVQTVVVPPKVANGSAFIVTGKFGVVAVHPKLVIRLQRREPPPGVPQVTEIEPVPCPEVITPPVHVHPFEEILPTRFPRE